MQPSIKMFFKSRDPPNKAIDQSHDMNKEDEPMPKRIESTTCAKRPSCFNETPSKRLAIVSAASLMVSDRPLPSPVRKEKEAIVSNGHNPKQHHASQSTPELRFSVTPKAAVSPSIDIRVKIRSKNTNVTPSNSSTKRLNYKYGSPLTPSAARVNDDIKDAPQHPHLTYDFLYTPKRLDILQRKPDDPDFDDKTLYVPEQFLNSQTPAMRQWWTIKQRNMDAILFFKMGKFYELFHEDAVVGVNELDIMYMKGDETKPAHAGFPEVSYEKYSKILVEKGYKVMRIEQTETPAMMESRCEETGRKGKFERVVRREVCRVTTRGTVMPSVMETAFSSAGNQYQYLLALMETMKHVDDKNVKTFGVCFVDVTISKLFVGQFIDDNNLSKLNILLAHHTPTEVLYERDNLSQEVHQTLLKTGAMLTKLKPLKEFWPIPKTFGHLKAHHIFTDNSGHFEWPTFFIGLFDGGESAESLLALEPKDEYRFALHSFGAVVYYLQSQLILEQVLKCTSFAHYSCPLDRYDRSLSLNQDKKLSLKSPPMIMDHIALKNLEIFENSIGRSAATLFANLNHCKTAFGERLLKNWLCSPLCDIEQINNRLDAVQLLANNENASLMNEIVHVLERTPDLERMLCKIKSQCFKSESDARAIMFDGVQHSKAKIVSFLKLLSAFKRLQKFIEAISCTIRNCESNVIKRLLSFTVDGGLFPDYSATLNYFDNAFDHSLAQQSGTIIPAPGVDQTYDKCHRVIEDLKAKLDEYLEDQKHRIKCRHIEYFGTGKNRYQIQVPEAYTRNVPSDYTIETTRKGFKRYYTPTVINLFKKLQANEEAEKKALDNIMSRIFEQFSRQMKLWSAAIECMAILDVLQSKAHYIRSLRADGVDVCRPEFIEDSDRPMIDYSNGRHPSLIKTNKDFIPNNLSLNEKLILLSGANMGGKSTLMRQTAVLVVLAQIGCFVTASRMRLTPVDRIFSRLGASDRLMEGESTFYTELVETSAMLRSSSRKSLLLLDELGRGTSTYDGTAIAYSVLREISTNIQCCCIFSTHYHTLVMDFNNDRRIRLAHMACEVESSSGADFGLDPTKETIKFLYKVAEGPVARSYGFNVAKLAGIKNEIIRDAYKRAKQVELSCKVLMSLQSICQSEEQIKKTELRERVIST